MKVLSGVRQSGKTTRLLEEANGRDDVAILCINKQCAKFTRNKAKELGFKVNIVTQNDLIYEHFDEIWVDDFEYYLRKEFGDNNVRVAVNECEVVYLNSKF